MATYAQMQDYSSVRRNQSGSGCFRDVRPLGTAEVVVSPNNDPLRNSQEIQEREAELELERQRELERRSRELERQQLVSDFLDVLFRDWTRETLREAEVLRSSIVNALTAFSNDQIRTMKRAGVRFWQYDSTPPFDLPAGTEPSQPDRGDRIYGIYQKGLLTIRINPNSVGNTGRVRHELAHAFDHTRNLGGRLGNFWVEQAPRQRIVRLITRLEARQLWSEANLDNAYRKYNAVIAWIRAHSGYSKNSIAFCGNSAYSTDSVKEFYAEGFRIYHAGRSARKGQAKLLYYANDLFRELRRSSPADGPYRPSPNDLVRVFRQESRQRGDHGFKLPTRDAPYGRGL